MPRERRIEGKDGIYDVLARGDRREDIVVDERDRDRFEETLEEVGPAWGANRGFLRLASKAREKCGQGPAN
jgi:hypothetical protein